MKKPIILTLIAVILCSVLYITFKRDFDQFNPLYKEHYVYAIVTKPDGTEGKNEWLRYRYNLTGYTKQGDRKKITFSSGTKLEQELYVKVLAKGSYTKEWGVVQRNEIPELALNSLHSN